MLDTEKVREIMRARDLNTSKLSKKIGISPQHLSNILGSTRGLSTETMKALAQALDVDVRDLLDNSPGSHESQPVISTQRDGSILVEKTNRLRVTLPAGEGSYELIKQLLCSCGELDNKIQEQLLRTDKATKEKILRMLEEAGGDKAG